MKTILFFLAITTLASMSAYASDSSVVCDKVAELLDVGPQSTRERIAIPGQTRIGKPCELRAIVTNDFCEISTATSGKNSFGVYFKIIGEDSWKFSKIDLTEGHININANRNNGSLLISTDDGISGTREKEQFKLSTEDNKLTVVYSAMSGIIFRKKRTDSCVIEL